MYRSVRPIHGDVLPDVVQGQTVGETSRTLCTRRVGHRQRHICPTATRMERSRTGLADGRLQYCQYI